jgi:hypothetical protein
MVFVILLPRMQTCNRLANVYWIYNCLQRIKIRRNCGLAAVGAITIASLQLYQRTLLRKICRNPWR